MPSEFVEQYQKQGRVKHAFLPNKLSSALCGRVVVWYLPESEQWKNDEFTLRKLRMCKHCKKHMS